MRDDIDVFMSAYASAEDAFEWGYCLAIAPFEWKWGDEDVRAYLGKSINDCVAQAVNDDAISEGLLKKALEGAAWAAVRRIHAFSEEEVEVLTAQISPWDFVSVDLVLSRLSKWELEWSLTHAAWFGSATFWKVADLWKK